MPLTALDHLIPFQPQALIAYLSLWVYVGVAPGLQLQLSRAGGLRPLGRRAVPDRAGASSTSGRPQVPPLALDVSGFPGFAMLQGVDAPGNACPSMHVAVAMFTAIWIEHVLRRARRAGAAAPRQLASGSPPSPSRRWRSSSTWCSTRWPARCWASPSRCPRCAGGPGRRGRRVAADIIGTERLIDGRQSRSRQATGASTTSTDDTIAP